MGVELVVDSVRNCFDGIAVVVEDSDTVEHKAVARLVVSAHPVSIARHCSCFFLFEARGQGIVLLRWNNGLQEFLS